MINGRVKRQRFYKKQNQKITERIEEVFVQCFIGSLRQVSGIKYLNQMSTYHLAGEDSEIT